MFIEHISDHKNRKPVYGVGLNDAVYKVTYKDNQGVTQKCPYYKKWTGMLERVFSPKWHKDFPTYVGCTVERAWLSFTCFRQWMVLQDWEGNALDKDLRIQGNKHYGPDTCLFISPALNNLLCLNNKTRGNLPLGVYGLTSKGHKYFTASCSQYGVPVRLGYYKTVDEAAEAYKKAKLSYIAELAAAQTNPVIKQALLALY